VNRFIKGLKKMSTDCGQKQLMPYFRITYTDMAKSSDELRLRGVSKEVKEDLINIAKNSGLTLSALLKPRLRDIRDSYPENLRRGYRN
jgi:hypothetical protein